MKKLMMNFIGIYRNKNQVKHKISKQKEINNIKVEINEMETTKVQLME